MLDFLGYMLFSGFEYLGLLYVTFNLFNLDFSRSKKEVLIVASFLVLVSYLIIVNNLLTIIPIPLVMLVTFVLMFMKILGSKRWKYSLVVTIGGLLFYLIMQTGIMFIFIYLKVLTTADINSPFSSNTYIMQTLYTSLSIGIGIYTKIFGNGFGFMLRKGKAYSFLITSIAMFVITFLCWLSYNVSEKFSLIMMVSIVAAILSVIFFYLSRRRDNFEFS